ncbi:MAG: imidazolonepropionase [Anaerolineae bacterium]|nr:MAG: imidazolonepropionase [Anaerolineae bacterium]
MLIHSASQLVTISGGPQRGVDLGRLGIIPNGAMRVQDGIIADIGITDDLLEKYPDEPHVDASGRVVMPGLVDPHTHVIWAGDRAAEFELRLEGKTYLEILASGGGILSTVQATRLASREELAVQTLARLNRMLALGTTTIEAKTGYGLSQDSELKMIKVLVELARKGPWDLAITYLPAHAIPPEYKDDADGYCKELAEAWLPEMKSWWQANAADLPLPFVDVFCETGAFTLEQTDLILRAAIAEGFPVKIHSDEFDNLGGTTLAVRLGAASADHLVAASYRDIEALGESNTVAVALPGTPFGLGTSDYAPGRAILAAGGILALASDLNPGTSWCESMQMAIALGCRQMKLTPSQAIAAATINAAAAIGKDGEVGSLEIGKQADFLILDVADYRHLGYRYGGNLVAEVYKRGIQVYSASGGSL